MKIFFNFLFLFVLTHASDQEEKKIEKEKDHSSSTEENNSEQEDKGILNIKHKNIENNQKFIETDIHEKMRESLKDGVDDPKKFDDEFTPYNYNDEDYQKEYKKLFDYFNNLSQEKMSDYYKKNNIDMSILKKIGINTEHVMFTARYDYEVYYKKRWDCIQGPFPKIHISAMPWSALKIWKLYTVFLNNLLPLSELFDIKNDQLFDEKITNLYNEYKMKKNFWNNKFDYKVMKSIPIMRLIYSMFDDEDKKLNFPYDVQVGKFITIYLDNFFKKSEQKTKIGDFPESIKEYSNFISHLDELFNHAKKIGYLEDKSFIPLVGDMQVGTSGGIYMRWEGNPNNDKYRYAPLVPVNNQSIPCFLDNLPVFWDHKWYLIKNCEDEQKGNGAWSNLRNAGKNPQTFDESAKMIAE